MVAQGGRALGAWAGVPWALGRACPGRLMIRLVNDCIILEGPQCAGLDNYSRLFCLRSPYFYWREAWLKRIASPEAGAADAAEKPERGTIVRRVKAVT
jgi:hypothetical protein